MKTLTSFLLLLYAAGTLAASLLPLTVNTLGKQVTDVKQNANQIQDLGQAQSGAKDYAAASQTNGLDNKEKADSASQSSSTKQATASDYAQKAANRDAAAKDDSKSVHKASASAFNQQASKSNAAAQSSAKDNTWTAQRTFQNGNHQKDDINYDYGKTFNNNDNQNGAYVFSQNSNAKARDSAYDTSSAYDRDVDQLAAASASADKQSSDRSSQGKDSASANQAAWDNYARNAANHKQLWANQGAFNNKLDASNAARKQKALSTIQQAGLNKAGLLRDSIVHQNGVGLGSRQPHYYYGSGFDSPLPAPYNVGAGYYGLQTGSYGPSSLLQASPGYGKVTGAGNYANLHNIGAQNQLQGGGAHSLQDNDLVGFNQNLWTQDQSQAFGNKQGASFADRGDVDKGNKADALSQRFSADSAATQAGRQQGQNGARLDEDAMWREAVQQTASDRDNNNKVYQQYFNNDNKNGNNWERMKYARNLHNNLGGFDNQLQRDRAFQDGKQASHQALSQDGQQADQGSAQEAAASRQFQDWERAAAGDQNDQAASDITALVGQKGLDNREFKLDQGQNRQDRAYQTQASKDQTATFYKDSDHFGAGPFVGNHLNQNAFQPSFPTGSFNLGPFHG